MKKFWFPFFCLAVMISFVFGFNFQSKTESLQSNRVVNDLSVNKDFTCNQFVVANGSVYSFQQIKDLLSADGEANLQNSKQHILNFDEENKLELIFLKDSVVELSAFSQAENIASKMQATRLDDGTVAIQIIDETDIVNISTSQDAQYSLHSLMFSTDATVNFADGQFNVGEKKGPTSFVDAATDIPTAKLVNLTSGSFGLSGTKTYSPKTVTTTAEDGTTSTGPQEGRAVYQGGGTLTISGITLDGFWLNLDEDTMGAAVMSDAGTLNLDCNITNSIAYMGSAAAVMGTCNILGGEYYNNVSWAGGIGTMGGTLNISGGKFYDNFSQYAGAAFANLQGTMIFENCEVYHNYAQYAAICTMYGTTTINGGKYYNNLGYAGGVSIIADESTMIVNGGEYYGNIAMYVGGVFNACPNTDASPITLTVNGGYYHDNHQTEEMTFELPEHAAKLMGVPEEERVAVLPVTYETQGYLFYLGNSPSESTVIQEKTTTFSLNGGTFSNNIPAGAEKAAEIWIEDYNYISLGMELTSDLHVYKNGLTSFANGDLASSYIVSTDNATYLQSAANHIKMIELPEIAVVTTQAKENYLVVERYHSGGLYNEETGALIYTWQELINNSYVTVSTSSTTQEDGTVVVSKTITAADNTNLAGMLVIPEGITGMGAMVIFQNETTTGLYLPKSLTNYLHEVDVENNVTDISVFLCMLLDNITVHSENPEFTDIDGVLYSKDLTKLVHVPGGKTGTITIADSVTEIVDAGCMAIQATEIVLPSGLLTAGDAAFAYTVMLENMVVPDSVQSFGYGAFMLSGLQAANGTLIDFRSSTDIPSLGEVGLEECPNSVKVWVPTELYYDWVEAENWKDYAHLLYADDVELVAAAPGVYNYETNELLYDWDTAVAQGLCTVSGGALTLNTAVSGTGMLYTIILPSSVTSIPASKWADCDDIAKLVIPSSVTSIGDQAFAQSQLREVIIKDAYCSIGQLAFLYMQNLTYLDIGDNITSIGMLAFAATLALTNSVANLSASCSFDHMSIVGSGFAQINIDPNHATYASIDGVVYSKDLTTLYCCPSGYVGEINIPSSVTTLGEGAFIYTQYLTGTVDISTVTRVLDSVPDLTLSLFSSSGLTKCILPALMTNIPADTFSSCSNLKELENVSNITSIGSSAFQSCISLETISFPNVQTIDVETFRDCTALRSIDWGNSLQTIGNYGFYRCTALDGTLTFPSTLTTIGEEGFQYCSGIDALVFDDCPVNINRYAFEYCSSIQSVDFGSQLRSLGNCVFRGNSTINGTITIPSTCTSIASYVFQDCTNIDRLVIEDASMSIGAMAFYNCVSMTSVSLGTKVTSIDQSAFRGAGISGTVSIPNTCSMIGDYAFHSCANLTGITIGTNVQTIGTAAFYGCSNVTSLTMNSTALITVGAEAFISLSKMAGSIAFPSTCTSIGQSAFNGCAALTRVTFAGSTAIANLAFYNCSKITYINLGTGVTSIGQSAFRGTKHSGSLTIPDTCTTIGDYAFQAITGITSLTIGSGCLSVGQLAFYGCTGITSLSLGSGIRTIGASAFRNLSNATGDIELPSIQTIGNYAFHTASKITSVTYGSSLTQLGDGVFANCTSLLSHNFAEATAIPTLTNANCFNNINANCKIWVPSTLYSDWKAATNWSNWEAYIFAWVDESKSGLFDSSTGAQLYTWQELIDGGYITVEGTTLKSAKQFDESIQGVLKISDQITAIADYCGTYNYFTTGIEVPDSVLTIGIEAFAANPNLQYVTIGSGVSSIGEIAFGTLSIFVRELSSITVSANNPYFKSVNNAVYTKDGKTLVLIATDMSTLNVLSGVTTIRAKACYSANITSVTLPSSLTTIEASAFAGCSVLETITFPDNVTEIGASAFFGCAKLFSINFGSGLTSIGDSAFGANGVLDSITNIYFTDATMIPTAGATIFKNRLKAGSKIYVPSSLYSTWTTATNWSEYASYMESIKVAGLYNSSGTLVSTWQQLVDAGTITVNSAGTSITASSAPLSGNLVIPTSITTIGSNAFKNRLSLTGVTFHDGITSIQSGAFYGCTYLAGTIVLPKSLKTIGQDAFYNCRSLKGVELNEGLETIGAYAFAEVGFDEGTTIVMPSSLKSIGSSAFNYPDNVYKYIFDFTKTSADVDIPYSSSLIGGSGIPYLTEYILPYERAFEFITSFWMGQAINNETIKWKDSSGNYYTDIGGLYDDTTNERLYSWSQLVSNGYVTVSGTTITGSTTALQGKLILSNTITEISSSAFANRTGITYLLFFGKLKTIGASAFSGCTSMKTVFMERYRLSSEREFGNNAFYNCSALTAVHTDSGAEMASGSIFSNMYSNPLYYARRIYSYSGDEIKTVDYSSHVVTGDENNIISSYAFYNCLSLTYIKIGGNIDIGAYAFAYCPNVLTFDFTEYEDDFTTYPACGNNAFIGINSNAKIIVPDAIATGIKSQTNWSTWASYIVSASSASATAASLSNVSLTLANLDFDSSETALAVVNKEDDLEEEVVNDTTEN